MRSLCPAVFITLLSGLVLFHAKAAGTALPQTNERIFPAKGLVVEINPAEKTVTVRHDAIGEFMGAMTMPFKVKSENDLEELKTGDEISFELHVTKKESWIGRIVKTGTAPLPAKHNSILKPAAVASESSAPALLDYKFTNELGQAVSLNDFRGQKLAVTFFYTRCPLPDYCPRLSKNFQETQKKLEAMNNAPTNWHLISISFDPLIDTPQMLKAYGESYGYDPKHWSFLTGPAEKISELAQACGVSYKSDNGLINHNFRTLIVDAAGHLQMVFPTSGDLSDQIVAEILKPSGDTNQPAENPNR